MTMCEHKIINALERLDITIGKEGSGKGYVAVIASQFASDPKPTPLDALIHAIEKMNRLNP